jgi:sigma-B regulation protein RsbQ
VDVRSRHHVVETGPPAAPVVMLAHGFGCDQHMWRLVRPRLAEIFRVVTFDLVGSGRSPVCQAEVKQQ